MTRRAGARPPNLTSARLLHYHSRRKETKGGKERRRAGGAAVWRPAVRLWRQRPSTARGARGGGSFTAFRYGNFEPEKHRQDLSRGQQAHRPRLQPGDRGQGIHRAGRPLRLRQVHHPADDRRPGGDHRGRAVHRRQADERRGTQGPGHRHGVPELRAVSPT